MYLNYIPCIFYILFQRLNLSNDINGSARNKLPSMARSLTGNHLALLNILWCWIVWLSLGCHLSFDFVIYEKHRRELAVDVHGLRFAVITASEIWIHNQKTISLCTIMEPCTTLTRSIFSKWQHGDWLTGCIGRRVILQYIDYF